MTASEQPPHTSDDPRIVRSRAKILDSSLHELREHGYDNLTVEGIAARAGVGKSTIYRHFEDKADLVVSALERLKIHEPHPLGTSDLHTDLVGLLTTLSDGLADPWADLIPTLIDAGTRDPALDVRRRAMIETRREYALSILNAAVHREELPADTDVDLGVDILAGWLFYRRFARNRPIDADVVHRAVTALIAALRSLPTG